jgi:alkylation response protein AidB-like acyl-CoA dehydrogenase
MDFDLTDEQRLLKESVDRLILDQYQFQQRKQYMAEPAGYSPAMWSRFAEQGLLGLPFPESTGGFGGGSIETMLVMEAFGRGLVVEPYFATVILAGGLLIRAGEHALSASLVPQITAGTLKLAFGHVERHSRYDLANVTTSARKDGGAYILNGAKSVVLHGDAADKILVTARIAGAPMDRDGIGLFLLDATAPGLTRRGYPTQDGLRAAELTLSGVRATVLSDNALPLI